MPPTVSSTARPVHSLRSIFITGFLSLRAPYMIMSWLELQTGDLYSQTSPSAVTARPPKPPLPAAGTIRAGPARDVNRSPWVRRRASPGLGNRGRTPWARSPCQRTSSEHRDRNLLAVRQTWSTSRYVVSSASELRVYEGGVGAGVSYLHYYISGSGPCPQHVHRSNIYTRDCTCLLRAPQSWHD